jgi:hypothetical protein
MVNGAKARPSAMALAWIRSVATSAGLGFGRQEFPTERTHYGTAGDLHQRNGKAEQTQDERAKQHRTQQQNERVERDAFRQISARVNSSQPGVILKKIGASPNGLTTGSRAPTISRIAPVSWPKSDQIIVLPLLRGFFQMPAESVAHG